MQWTCWTPTKLTTVTRHRTLIISHTQCDISSRGSSASSSLSPVTTSVGAGGTFQPTSLKVIIASTWLFYEVSHSRRTSRSLRPVSTRSCPLAPTAGGPPGWRVASPSTTPTGRETEASWQENSDVKIFFCRIGSAWHKQEYIRLCL